MLKWIALAVLFLIVVPIVYLLILFSSPLDSCLDNGGYWNDKADKCECTYTDRGVYEDDPTASQLSERDRCDAIVRKWGEDRERCEAVAGEWRHSQRICIEQ